MGCYYSSVYVDAHGEPDAGMRRGRPLFLDARRMRALRELWAGHGVARCVSRQRNGSDMLIRPAYF